MFVFLYGMVSLKMVNVCQNVREFTCKDNLQYILHIVSAFFFCIGYVLKGPKYLSSLNSTVSCKCCISSLHRGCDTFQGNM
jgi:hypothetical protein